MSKLFSINLNKKNSWNDDKNSPPDLDELFQKIGLKLRKLLFGGGISNGSPNKKSSVFGIIFVIAIIIASWVSYGFFVVEPAQDAVIVRFGKFSRTLGPGLHWIPRMIENKYIIDVKNIYKISYTDSMLTKDENYVIVSLAVQYKIVEPKNYLYSTVDPIGSLSQATASALRQIIGNTDLNSILTVKREEVRSQVQDLVINILKRYNVGIKIVDVLLLPAKPPEEVKSAFDDAIKAQEDEEKYINEAQAYSMGVIPIAKGQAKRIIASATAYKQEQILLAEGDVKKFNLILKEYIKFPNIIKERIYLDTMQKVYSTSTKVFLDTKEGTNPFLYLPIDKLLEKSNISVNSSSSRNNEDGLFNKDDSRSSRNLNNGTDSSYSYFKRPGYE